MNAWQERSAGEATVPPSQILASAARTTSGVIGCVVTRTPKVRSASLMPMAAEMPDIDVAHVETPTSASQLGAKGVGESGTGAAPAVVMNAINDALLPFGARVTTQPITPEV